MHVGNIFLAQGLGHPCRWEYACIFQISVSTAIPRPCTVQNHRYWGSTWFNSWLYYVHFAQYFSSFISTSLLSSKFAACNLLTSFRGLLVHWLNHFFIVVAAKKIPYQNSPPVGEHIFFLRYILFAAEDRLRFLHDIFVKSLSVFLVKHVAIHCKGFY